MGHSVCPFAECQIVVHPKTGRMILHSGSLWAASTTVMKELGRKNDLEAMAIIVEVAASAYGTYDRMLPQLSNVFLGIRSSGPGTLPLALVDTTLMRWEDECHGVGRDTSDCPGNVDYFTDLGFHPDFRDNNNQLFHVWAYIAETSFPQDPRWGQVGQATGALANWLHDSVQTGPGVSLQDYHLSQAGMEIGLLITNQAISPAELADVIRWRLGIGGPGSH
jgi:hypothetical protein